MPVVPDLAIMPVVPAAPRSYVCLLYTSQQLRPLRRLAGLNFDVLGDDRGPVAIGHRPDSLLLGFEAEAASALLLRADTVIGDVLRQDDAHGAVSKSFMRAGCTLY